MGSLVASSSRVAPHSLVACLHLLLRSFALNCTNPGMCLDTRQHTPRFFLTPGQPALVLNQSIIANACFGCKQFNTVSTLRHCIWSSVLFLLSFLLRLFCSESSPHTSIKAASVLYTKHTRRVFLTAWLLPLIYHTQRLTLSLFPFSFCITRASHQHHFALVRLIILVRAAAGRS